MQKRWQTYHQQTKSREISPLLKEAITFVKNKNAALDLGAGALIESRFLLSEGFKKVISVDIVPFEPIDTAGFTFVESSFETYDFPKEAFDIINAQFSLPFTDPKSFPNVWKKMTTSLVIGGVFSGQLFGQNDDWSNEPSMTFHTRVQIEKMLSGFETIKLEEIEKDAPLAGGGTKHWHVFALIFRKTQNN